MRQTVSKVKAKGGGEYLVRLAAAMMRDAKKHPGDVIRPERPLGNGAHLVMKYGAGMFWLRVGRKGLAPANDFSRESGRRRRMWNREVQTFLEAFGARGEVNIAQGADGLFYFADCIWSAPSAEAGAGRSKTGEDSPQYNFMEGMRQ